MAEGIKKISENVIIDKRALVVTDPLVSDNDAISIGALWSDPAKKGLKIKTGRNAFSLLDASSVLEVGSVITNLLADKCVTNIKVADSAINDRTLENNSVTEPKIKNLNVTEPKLADRCVTRIKIKELNVYNEHIAEATLTGNKFADKTLTGDKIADKTINNINLADSSVNDRTLAEKCLFERHFNDLCIPHRAYQSQSVYGDVIKNAGIESIHMAINSVNTDALMNGSVTGDKLAEASVFNKHLTKECVENANLAINSVNEKNMFDQSVSTRVVKNKSITKDKLADDVVNLIGDPVVYDSNNDVTLRKDLTVPGNINAKGTITAAKVFNATFMDIAEGYEPDKDTVYVPGDIVQVNEEGKLIKAINSSHFPIVGIVSDEYAACYGATEEELTNKTKIAVGLIGKVHVNVVGPVKLGDRIALAKDGMGASYEGNNLMEDQIIGKALESNDKTELKKVLCLIYPR